MPLSADQVGAHFLNNDSMLARQPIHDRFFNGPPTEIGQRALLGVAKLPAQSSANTVKRLAFRGG
jgi:hypothetical protein